MKKRFHRIRGALIAKYIWEVDFKNFGSAHLLFFAYRIDI
jgi:hypothetical protein